MTSVHGNTTVSLYQSIGSVHVTYVCTRVLSVSVYQGEPVCPRTMFVGTHSRVSGEGGVCTGAPKYDKATGDHRGPCLFVCEPSREFEEVRESLCVLKHDSVYEGLHV